MLHLNLAFILRKGTRQGTVHPRRSIFLSDPVRPVGGIEDAVGVDDAWPSVLYAPTGP